MLTEPKITSFIPTTQAKRSRQFYQDTLGLVLVSEDNFAMEFRGGDTLLRVTIVNELSPHPFTVLGFRINEIEKQVKSLSTKGVNFERYDHFDMSDLGIWSSSSRAKVAWFKDPDGNLLSLTEYPK